MSGLVRRALLLLAVLALAVGVAACGGNETAATTEGGQTPQPVVSGEVPPDAIALVDGEKIPKSAFDALIGQAKSGYEAQQQEFPQAGTPEYEQLKGQAVQYLVQRVQFRQQAKALGVLPAPAELDKRLEELKQQYFGGDEKQFEAQLAEQKLTLEQVRSDVEAQLISEKLFDAVTKDAALTDEEIRKYYDENKAQFTQPETRDVRHILLRKKARADELYEQLQNGADFAELAKKFSQDPGSKAEGGKYEDVAQGQFVAEFDSYLFDPETKTNDISEPIKTQFGWHIVQPLSDIQSSKVTAFDEAKDSIRQQLLDQKKNDAMTQWVADLEQKYEGKVVYAVGYAPPVAAAPADTGAAGTSGATTAAAETSAATG